MRKKFDKLYLRRNNFCDLKKLFLLVRCVPRTDQLLSGCQTIQRDPQAKTERCAGVFGLWKQGWLPQCFSLQGKSRFCRRFPRMSYWRCISLVHDGGSGKGQRGNWKIFEQQERHLDKRWYLWWCLPSSNDYNCDHHCLLIDKKMI